MCVLSCYCIYAHFVGWK